MNWQPIETAPKTRKVIVHYLNELGKSRTAMACYYVKHHLEMDGDYTEFADYDEASGTYYAPEGWYEEHDSDYPMERISQPTHWMPLPAPPQVTASHSGAVHD